MKLVKYQRGIRTSQNLLLCKGREIYIYIYIFVLDIQFVFQAWALFTADIMAQNSYAKSHDVLGVSSLKTAFECTGSLEGLTS